ncbi:hypothetical protein [Croceibacterium ferulae]|uniref:hypothetical protein n=1 Tax=Croceibacterium ferulae TaxID=1854641 RepID=UPI000EB39A5C|nr:hypothetical protein [Croceibacterium ferulae]
MNQPPDPDEQARRDEFDKHYKKFFELIGHCVTLYQSVEDYLDDVFSAALGGNVDRAAALFAVARGLEAKLNIISAALIGREDDLAKHWPSLLVRVASAAKARNEIAHASPLVRGGRIDLVLDREKMQVVCVGRPEKDRMELRKRTKAGETTRVLDDLFEEYHRTGKLFDNLIGYVKLLKGEVAPTHLLEGLEG